MPVATSMTRRYAAELHKRARRPSLTRRVWVQGEHPLNREWTADSWHMASWQKGLNSGKNGGFKYVAVYLDVFSRYAWTVPLKTLTAAEQLQAFQKVRKEAGATPAILARMQPLVPARHVPRITGPLVIERMLAPHPHAARERGPAGALVELGGVPAGRRGRNRHVLLLLGIPHALGRRHHFVFK